jgi:methylmalonyl-CoA mutase
VLGITGTGGAGKSSLTDELILRLRLDQEDRLRVAVISIDPSRKRTGGALLGDRIRMNAIDSDKIFMRSLATRDTGNELSAALPEVLACCKIERLRFDRGGDLRHRPGRVRHRAAGRHLALRHDAGVRRGLPARKNRHARFCRLRRHQQIRPQGRRGCAARRAQAVPAQPRILFSRRRTACRCTAPWPRASTTTASLRSIRPMLPRLQEKGLKLKAGKLPRTSVKASSRGRAIVPPERVRYLAEIAESVRDYHRTSARRRARRASANRSRPRRTCSSAPASRRRSSAT